MAEIIKWQAGQVMPVIKHNLRRFEDGKATGNEAIKPEKTPHNYSLINRGSTCKEVNRYRHQIEAECFKYNRKNLVHSVEVVIQAPSDCPASQREAFFQESFNYVCSTLPMGERCVFVAEVHKDEEFIVNGENLSKEHLHIMYVPAVKDTKHDGFEYKLCADDLTKRAKLCSFHKELQAHLNSKGVAATVLKKQDGDGKAISLSVDQLKEFSSQTGLKLDSTLTINELAGIVNENLALSKQIDILQSQIQVKENELLHIKTADVSADKEKALLQEKLQEKIAENQKLHSAAQQIITDKNTQLSAAQQMLSQKEQEIDNLKSQLQAVQIEQKNKELELQQANEKIEALENQKAAVETTHEQTWGEDSAWGSSNGWGNTTTKNVEVEV